MWRFWITEDRQNTQAPTKQDDVSCSGENFRPAFNFLLPVPGWRRQRRNWHVPRAAGLLVESYVLTRGLVHEFCTGGFGWPTLMGTHQSGLMGGRGRRQLAQTKCWADWELDQPQEEGGNRGPDQYLVGCGSACHSHWLF